MATGGSLPQTDEETGEGRIRGKAARRRQCAQRRIARPNR
jgi:hypothetical protein